MKVLQGLVPGCNEVSEIPQLERSIYVIQGLTRRDPNMHAREFV